MASVARAIEQAASCTVDDSLWWDSHESLFNFLDDYVSGFRRQTPNQVLGKLKANNLWLSGTLLQFKAPNEKSRSALDVARVILGSHTLEINADIRNIAIQISKTLVLDEVQAYILVSRCFNDAKKPAAAELLQKMTLSYFTERQCLLKSLRLLLLSHMAESSEKFDMEPIDASISLLIDGGLESNIFATLQNLLDIRQPLDLDLSSMNLWAEEVATEVNLVMDIMFLLYYKPLCSCSFDRWNALFRMCQEKILSGTNIERLSVTSEAKTLIENIKNQAVLILLEILDLDKVLSLVFDDVPFSQDRYPFSVKELQQMDEAFGQLSVLEVREYSPLLLGWGVFSCLLSFLPTNDKSSLEVDHISYIQQAHQGGAFYCLLEIVQQKGIQGSNIDGYKCVIKSVISSFCASYDIINQNDSTVINTIVEILYQIYVGQEILCIEFWDRESILDSPLRNLLYTLRESFPYQLKPLMKLLAGLTEGIWPAECVFNFLYKPTEITCESPQRRMAPLRDGDQFVSTASIEFSGTSALFIPSGTIGIKLKEVDDQSAIMLWKCKHSAILILVMQLSVFCVSEDSWTEVHVIVKLFHRMLSCNKMLAEAILLLDESDVCKDARAAGCMEETARVNPLAVICMLLDKLMELPGGNSTAALCMDILGTFAGCYPFKVMLELSNAPSSWSTKSFLNGGLLAKCLAAIYKDLERCDGTHPLVIGVLNLCISLVSKRIVTESLEKIVVHIVANLFVNHMTWKYGARHEQWKIATKVFELGHLVLSDAKPNSLQLTARVLEVIMVDSAFQNALLRILSTTEFDLKGLYLNRFADLKEIEWFERALCSGLILLHQALSTYLASYSATDTKSTTLLEHAVLHHTVGTMPFVACVASLIGIFQNQPLQLASIKMLTTLCHVAAKAKPHPINILSYVQGPEQKNYLRRTIGRLLSRDMAELNFEVYNLSVDLMKAAAKYQVSFMEMLLCPSNAGERLDKFKTETVEGNEEKLDGSYGSVEASIWEMLSDVGSLLDSEPQILSPILSLLEKIWELGTEFPGITEVFRQRNDFWKLMVSCVSNTLDRHKSSDEFLVRSFRYQCQTFVLQIMAREFFLQRCRVTQQPNGESSHDHAGESHNAPGTIKNGHALTLFQLVEALDPVQLKYSISDACFDKLVISRLKAEMRGFIVSLLLKILNDDEVGVSASLLRYLHQSLKEVVDHSSFQGLLNNYLSHGYGSGKELQILVMNDLYFHLQGQLEAGRHIPSGLFEDLVSVLDTVNLSPFFLYGHDKQFPDNYSLYDTTLLREHLGLEWWCQTDSHIEQTAENFLDLLQQANSVACLGASQVSSLEALSNVFALFITNKKEIGNAIKDKWVVVCITELCTCLCSSLKFVVPDGDPTYYVDSLICGQAHFLNVLVKWICVCPEVVLNGELEDLCLKVLNTLLATMRTMWKLKTTRLSFEAKLIRSALGACLSCLTLMRPEPAEPKLSNTKSEDSYLTIDGISKLEAFSMELLPMLCTLVEEKRYINLTIAVICVLIKSFLAPPIWLPIFEAHSTAQFLLLMLHTAEIDTAYQIVSLLLSLCYFRNGIDLLQSAEVFSHIMTYMANINHDDSFVLEDKEPCEVLNVQKRKKDLWTICVAIVTMITQTTGEDGQNNVIGSAFAFFESQREHLIYALQLLCQPEANGTKRTKFGHPIITVSSLKETHQALHLLVALVKHRSSWFRAISGSEIKVTKSCIHLLAYIAREGLKHNTDGNAKTRLHCRPEDKEDVAAQAKHSRIGCGLCWFAVAAKGSYTCSRNISLGLDHQGAIMKSSSASEIHNISTEYSDSVAIYIYNITLLLLHFLLKDAEHAMRIIDDGSTHNFKSFPEFPAPEVLHGLQDQAITVIADICSTTSKGMSGYEQQKVCNLMMNMLEGALFLEVCVSRLCGIGPLSARSEDFIKEFKQLLNAVEGKLFPDTSLKTLKCIAAMAYPALN